MPTFYIAGRHVPGDAMEIEESLNIDQEQLMPSENLAFDLLVESWQLAKVYSANNFQLCDAFIHNDIA